MGIKIFDGDTLKKRLQLTFESEGNFNMFSNKIRQWLGTSLLLTANLADNIPSNSQHASQVTSSQNVVVIPDSQLVCGSLSQILLNTVTEQASTSQNLMNDVIDLTSTAFCYPLPVRDPLSYPYYNDPISLLLGAAELANQDRTQYSQQDTFRQSTQIGYNDSLQTSLFSHEPHVTKLGKQGNANDYSRAISGEEIYKALTDIPFTSSEIHKPHRRKPHKTSKGDKFELAMVNAIKEVINTKEESLHDLSDQELALKIARVLKSKSFLRLIHRVDSLLQSLPEYNG